MPHVIDAAAGGAGLDISDLYEAHGAFLARCIERMCGRGPHVEDLLHDTFIAAHKRSRSFDPARADPRTWLYGIAANVCRVHRRGLRRWFSAQSRFAADAPAAPAGAAPDEQLALRQRAKLVQELLGKLPFKQREVFALYELEELDGETIAQLLGVPPGTVASRLHQARKTFQELLRARKEAAP